MTRTSAFARTSFRRSGLVLAACQAGLLATAALAASQPIVFVIVRGIVRPTQPFAARITMIGASIQMGPLHYPVTTRVHLKTAEGVESTIDPFGRFDRALTGNVNPDVPGTVRRPPFSYTLRGMNPANLEISITGRSWKLISGRPGTQNIDWTPHMTKHSSEAAFALVLRNGDPVPNVAGFMGQSSVEAFLQRYINFSTNTVRLTDNQAIYLFELGTSDASSPARDWQDLVMLVTLADSPAALDDRIETKGD